MRRAWPIPFMYWKASPPKGKGGSGNGRRLADDDPLVIAAAQESAVFVW